jgi:signal transduction histidine kinase
VLSLQVFLTAISVPLVLLAALVEEQIQTGNTLRASEQRLLNLQQEGQQRIAQELHDSTSQHLTAMALNLTALRSKAGEDAAALIKEISDSLREATRELVSFGYLLHPAEVQRDGLHSTLRRYVDGFAKRTQLEVKFRAAGTIDELPLAVQEALLRIVQEALANVYRHASASRVTIKFSYVRQRLHVVIVDDGVGIEDTPLSGDRQASSLGVGIPGMKVRARRLGGKINVRSRPGGTVVHAVLPI